jgi:metallo-beta-lactamase class B
MKNFIFLIIAAMFLTVSVFSQEEKTGESFTAFKGVEITKLSKNAYAYTYHMPAYRNSTANGMFYISRGKALLIDTPGDDPLTDSLINWITERYNVKVEGVVITHWHMEDRMGGLNAAHKRGIKSYASALTVQEAKKRNLPVPQNSFEKSMTLKIGGRKIICEFPGGGHTVDNSIVWFPEDKTLFGGCLIKDYKAKSLGYTKDADLKAWPLTMKKIQKKYGGAEVIIPGHGEWGSSGLTLKNNIELLEGK